MVHVVYLIDTYVKAMYLRSLLSMHSFEYEINSFDEDRDYSFQS